MKPRVRKNEVAAYEVEFAGAGGAFGGDPNHKFVVGPLLGGRSIETNKKALSDHFEKLLEAECRVRVLVKWRNLRKMWAWLSDHHTFRVARLVRREG